jgi:hypothetical protein
MTIFVKEDFVSHAGLDLKWKIECDGLTEDDWECLALMISEIENRPFSKVVGIPRGGLPLQYAMEKYATGDEKHPVLIVDDVYTTGTSFNDFVEENYADQDVICWVAFARNPANQQVNALFQMASSIWKNLK